MEKDVSEITRILQEWNDGKEEAKDQLLPFVYDELRRQAAICTRLDEMKSLRAADADLLARLTNERSEYLK